MVRGRIRDYRPVSGAGMVWIRETKVSRRASTPRGLYVHNKRVCSCASGMRKRARAYMRRQRRGSSSAAGGAGIGAGGWPQALGRGLAITAWFNHSWVFQTPLYTRSASRSISAASSVLPFPLISPVPPPERECLQSFLPSPIVVPFCPPLSSRPPLVLDARFPQSYLSFVFEAKCRLVTP